MDGSLAHRGGLPAWTAWALLAASVAPLAFVLVEAHRLLLGAGPAFLRSSEEPASTYLRATYLLQIAQPDRVLLVALLGLAAAAWLLRSSPVAPRPDLAGTCAAVLTCGLAALAAGLVVVTAYLATSRPPDDQSDGFSPLDRLDSLGAPAAAGLVLAVLSVLLLRLVLAERARPQPVGDPADDDPPDDDPPDDGPVRLSLDDGAEPEPEPEPEEPQRDDAVQVRLVEEPALWTPAPVSDAHSVFRRPDAPGALQPRSSGSVPVAPAPLAGSAAYRRPLSEVPVDETTDEGDPHAPHRGTSSSASLP